MIRLQYSDRTDFDLAIVRYTDSQLPFLVILANKEEFKCYYNQKKAKPDWCKYITEELKLLLIRQGFKSVIKQGKLYAYDDVLTNYVSNTDPVKTECFLEVRLLTDYGISTSQLVNLVVESTTKYLVGRRV